MSASVQEQAPSITAQERVIDMYERRYNDATTLAAEMLDGSMQTPFEYELDGEELYAQDGSAMGNIFEKAEDDAYVIAAADPRLTCEIRRRGLEKGEYHEMIDMAKGHGPNTMIVVSDTPWELDEWGEDVGGYNFTRRQTMLRVISRLPGGNIRVISQTLDKSDRDGLESIYAYFGCKPEPGELLGQRIRAEIDPARQELLPDELTREYDHSLEEKFGGRFYAGRTPADIDNTYDFVRQQKDLLGVFMEDTSDDSLLGLIAALENRWNARKAGQGILSETENYVVIHGILTPELEMQHLAQRAMQLGKTYSGCGMTINAEGELAELGYGNKSVEKQEWYGRFKKIGTCVNCEDSGIEVGEASWCEECIVGHCGTKK